MFWGKRDLAGDVVVITGGGMGIGRLMALRFASLGCKVAIWDFNAAAGQAVQQEIEDAGGVAEFFEADVTDRAKVIALAKQVEEKFGHVDILVNNAGFVGGKPIGEWDDAQILRSMNVNLISHFWTIKAFLTGMIARNKGYIVEIASVAGIMGSAGMCEYGAAKSGVIGLTKSLQAEFRGKHITGLRTLLVCPSYISTGMFEGAKPPLLTSWLSPEYVAERIVHGVQTNQSELIMPGMVRFMLYWVGVFPTWVGNWFCHILGGHNTMDQFKSTRAYLSVKND